MEKQNLVCMAFLVISMSIFVSIPSAHSKPFWSDRTNAIVVSEIEPSKGDVKRIDRLRELSSQGSEQGSINSEERRVYAVKLYVEFPSTFKAANLWIGDTMIGEYGSFSEGIFFKVYDNNDLDRLFGKPIRFVAADLVYDSEISFPKKEDAFSKMNDTENRKLPSLAKFILSNS